VRWETHPTEQPMKPIKTLFILFSLFTMLMADKAIPKDNIETNTTLQADQHDSRGVSYYKKGNYDKALEAFNKSLKIKLATIGENSPDTATSYNNIGVAWISKGEYDKAIEFHKKALKIRLATIGENNPATATSYNNIGEVWRSKGEYDKAIKFHKKALKIRLATIGENNPATATSYNNIGLAWSSKGEYDKAIEFHKKALKIRLATIGENSPDTATSYNNIGVAWISKGEYDKAIEFHKKALKIRLATIGENNPATATSYNNIGSAWYSKGEYDKAIEFHEKTLKIYIPKLGENHPSTITIKNNLAYAFRGLGSKYKKEKNYTKAIDYYSRALLLHKKILSDDPKYYSDEVFDDMHQIIQTHQIIKPQKAKEIYTKSLNYFQKLFKQDKKSHAINYIKMIIQGVEQFDLDSNRLDEAKEILATLPDSSEKKGLLLQIEELEGGYGIYILILSILFFGGTVFYFKRYKNPLVAKLTNPKALLTLNTDQLKEAKTRLTKIDRFKNILAENHITQERYKKAEIFNELDPKEKANYFAKRVFATSTELTPQSHMLTLSDDFPLNVKQFILFMSNKESIADMMSEIKQIPQYSKNILFILGDNAELQAKIATEKGYEKFVRVEPQTMTKLLLAEDGAKVLADSFAEQLALTQISPYNLGGGESNSSMFFGRREIISHVVGRGNNNYIVIGSRQIGKSSLLKAIEREYVKNQERVHYISVGKGNFVRAMGRALGIKVTSLEELVAYISVQKEKVLFLLDEVDPFIKDEKERGYKVLDSFRKLSEEGSCNFILAGYWELYFYTMFDNQSPLKNFGEAIELGALEAEACREMITEPMQQLGLRFESDEAINEIVERTGQRPNLIAIICNNIIKSLGKEKRVVSMADVQEAIKGKKVYELFESWKKLDEDEEASKLDKIIVYSMVEQGSFRLAELVEKLKALGLRVEMSRLETSLARLKVSYTIERNEEGVYGFMLPLFREYVLRDDYEVKLAGEVEGYL